MLKLNIFVNYHRISSTVIYERRVNTYRNKASDGRQFIEFVPAALGEKHRRPEGESWFWDLEWDSRLDSAVSRQT